MSDIDLAITHSKRLEFLLEQKLGATGKGLHEKVSSVESRLPPQLTRNLRRVATVRNKIVHESSYTAIDDRKGFLKAAKESERQLKAMGGGKRAGAWLLVAGALVLLGALLLAYWYFSRR